MLAKVASFFFFRWKRDKVTRTQIPSVLILFDRRQLIHTQANIAQSRKLEELEARANVALGYAAFGVLFPTIRKYTNGGEKKRKEKKRKENLYEIAVPTN